MAITPKRTRNPRNTSRRGTPNRPQKIDRHTSKSAGDATPIGIIKNLMKNSSTDELKVKHGISKIMYILTTQHGSNNDPVLNKVNSLRAYCNKLKDTKNLSREQRNKITMIDDYLEREEIVLEL